MTFFGWALSVSCRARLACCVCSCRSLSGSGKEGQEISISKKVAHLTADSDIMPFAGKSEEEQSFFFFSSNHHTAARSSHTCRPAQNLSNRMVVVCTQCHRRPDEIRCFQFWNAKFLFLLFNFIFKTQSKLLGNRRMRRVTMSDLNIAAPPSCLLFCLSPAHQPTCRRAGLGGCVRAVWIMGAVALGMIHYRCLSYVRISLG